MFRSLILALTLAAPIAPAFAGSSDAAQEDSGAPNIEATGITAFDSVFMRVKDIHDTLDSAQARIQRASDGIAVAVGQPEGTSLAMSLWTLKQTAGGPVDVQMQGTKPVLTIGGAGSAEAQGMVAAVNTAAVDVAGIPADLADLPQQVMGLVEACKAFPGQLNPQLLSEAGLKPLELPKVAKILGRNVKATVATPGRIESLVGSAKGFVEGIPQGLSATEAPTEEALASQKADRKASKADRAANNKPSAAPELPATAIHAMVGDAMDAFRDAEVAQATQLLVQADATLATLSQPVPASELAELYQSSAVVHLVGGNAPAAMASVAQALVMDPDAKPLPELGPEYAKLHKVVAKADALRDVTVHVQGEGHALLSGTPVSDGTTVAAGRHLLQIEQGGQWTSQLVWVQDGFTVQL